MPEPASATGALAKLAVTGGRHAKQAWDRDRIRTRIVKALAKAVFSDARVHPAVRQQLAKALPRRLGTDPTAQGLLARLVAGVEVDASCQQLGLSAARLLERDVAWP